MYFLWMSCKIPPLLAAYKSVSEKGRVSWLLRWGIKETERKKQNKTYNFINLKAINSKSCADTNKKALNFQNILFAC